MGILLLNAQSVFAQTAGTSTALQVIPLITGPIISTAITAATNKPKCAPGPFSAAAFINTLCSSGSTATNINTSTQNWTWTCSKPPAKDVSCSATVTDQNQGQVLNGISISFQGTYSITNTTADIPARISVLKTQNVSLSTYVALAGSNFTTSQPLLSQSVTPNTPVNTKISFTGLTAGQTYTFAIKNNITGIFSTPIQFTTTGGTNGNGGTIGTVGANLQNGIPDASPAVTDTISDKGIVPKCGRTGTSTDTTGTQMCTFKDFMQLIANVIQYGLIILGPIIAILAMYAGAMIIWLGRKGDRSLVDQEKLRGYEAILVRAAIGLVIIVTAWTLISTILIELGVQHQYILLDIFSGH